MKESTELRATRMIYVGSFLVSAVLLIALSLKQPLRSNVAAGYLFAAALVAGTLAIGRLRGKRAAWLRFFLLIAVLNIVIVPPELYLRLRGFRYESGIQFGYPRPYQFSAFQLDEKLFWKFPPGRPGVNKYGFEGPEVTLPKPPGVYRIMFLGNSATYQGHPKMVELIMRGAHPEVECLNFAIPGYTSYQGRIVARDYAPALEPDLFVVSFGWNDRWLAYGSPDESKGSAVTKGGGSGALSGLYARWRLLQFCRRALAGQVGRANEQLDTPRVPLDRFSANLRAIAAVADSLGIPILFATEPSSYRTLGVPDYVVSSKYAKAKEDALRLLGEYNEVIREIARGALAWHLIDLDSLMSGRPDVRELFMEDGIHYSKSGTAVVADIEARYISEHFLAPHGTRR